MKNLLKKWIFIAQFHLQDPDPDSEHGSGSIQSGDLNPDPPGSGYTTLVVSADIFKSLSDIFSWTVPFTMRH